MFWEAMRDRLHQPQRESLVPGLTEALALPRMQGLLGVALERRRSKYPCFSH